MACSFESGAASPFFVFVLNDYLKDFELEMDYLGGLPANFPPALTLWLAREAA